MLRASFISAAFRISQHGDATNSISVKRKNSKGRYRTSEAVKQKATDHYPEHSPPKVRKIEKPEVSSQKQIFCAAAIADKQKMKPRPGPSDSSVSSTGRVMRPVRTDLVSEKPSASAVVSKIVESKGNQPPPSIVPENQPGSGIFLAKENRSPPLILVEKIESCEGYLFSQKRGRVEQAKQLKFKCEVLGIGVYTARSTKPGAGVGLYVARNFSAHVLITECVGEMITVPTGSKSSKMTWDKIGSNYESWSYLIAISDHKIFQGYVAVKGRSDFNI